MPGVATESAKVSELRILTFLEGMDSIARFMVSFEHIFFYPSHSRRDRKLWSSTPQQVGSSGLLRLPKWTCWESWYSLKPTLNTFLGAWVHCSNPRIMMVARFNLYAQSLIQLCAKDGKRAVAWNTQGVSSFERKTVSGKAVVMLGQVSFKAFLDEELPHD